MRKQTEGYPKQVSGTARFKTNRGVTWLETANLSDFPWLIHAFSTRLSKAGGGRNVPAELDLGMGEARPSEAAATNRKRFFRALGAGAMAVAEIHQIHSAEIWEVRSGSPLEYRPAGYELPYSPGRKIWDGDALMTADRGTLLAIRTADCLPVLIADSRQRIIAAVHAGWRGSLRRVIEKTVGEMRRLFNCDPGDLRAALGPSIRGCCYEVGQEVVDAFYGSFPRAERFFSKAGRFTSTENRFLSLTPPGHELPRSSGLNLDLTAVALDQLESAGVRASEVCDTSFCTACRNDLFFSYRKEGSSAGRMMAVIGVRE